MGAFHSYEAIRLSARGTPIPVGSDTPINVALPADYQLGATVGGSMRVIEQTSDRSATATVTAGEHTLPHVLLSALYAEQEVAKVATGSPVGQYAIELANGDTVVGRGVLVRPGTLEGSVVSTTRAWTVLLSEATVQFAVGLEAALAAAGAV